MRYPTEIREFVEYDETKNYVITNNELVVNIKMSNEIKEEINMLENEKTFELEQLNLIKAKYEKNLEELKARDINAVIEEEIAKVREEITTDVVAKNENAIQKVEFLLEAIVEKIAEVEAIEVEAPVIDEVVNEDVPADEQNFNDYTQV